MQVLECAFTEFRFWFSSSQACPDLPVGWCDPLNHSLPTWLHSQVSLGPDPSLGKAAHQGRGPHSPRLVLLWEPHQGFTHQADVPVGVSGAGGPDPGPLAVTRPGHSQRSRAHSSSVSLLILLHYFSTGSNSILIKTEDHLFPLAPHLPLP